MSRRTNLRRLAVKIKLIDMMGGKCQICGYENLNCVSAYDFHHRDPEEKKFYINKAVNQGYAWEDIIIEVKKCDLLCCRCHREIENNQPDVNIEELFKSFKDRKRKIGTLESRKGIPTKEELMELVKDHSLSEIGRSFGVVGGTIRHWCQKFEINLPKIRYKVNQIPSKEELFNMINKESASQIGAKFGVSDKTVGKWLKKYDIENPRSKIFYRTTKIDW